MTLASLLRYLVVLNIDPIYPAMKVDRFPKPELCQEWTKDPRRQSDLKSPDPNEM